ncbi:MAG: hypothetical protein ACRENQ_02105 [Gemmatimonadaceae bacterium]
MHHYQLFGGVLASGVEFPELPIARPTDVRWALTPTNAPPSTDPLPLLGAEPVTDGVEVALRGSAGRFRLTYGDTGVFEIDNGGRTIVWHRPDGPSVDLASVRTDVLGRVMAVALHAEGILTLHGSGVAVGGRAVAFLAPKLHGKSTTAAALVRAGAQLLGDDILAVTFTEPPMVLPGIPAVNLWRDSADRFRPAAGGDAAAKQRIDWDALGSRANAPTALDAVYLLGPVPAESGEQVRRLRMPSVAAALALVGQAKIGGLLGPTNAAALLEQAARLSAAVPVYRLTIPRELDRLDELVRRIFEWHDLPSSAGAARAAAG